MRYVDAEKELAEMKFAWYPQDMDTTNAIGMYENFLKNAPSADVVPVVHSHWIEEEDCTVYTDIPWSMCAACSSYSPKLLYCAFCGAKMDEEVE